MTSNEKKLYAHIQQYVKIYNELNPALNSDFDLNKHTMLVNLAKKIKHIQKKIKFDSLTLEKKLKKKNV